MRKEDILAEIVRTAAENGGKPLGVARFEQATGIRPYDWGKYWARFGDAIREAGLEPNTLNAAFSDEVLLDKLAKLIAELGKFPTNGEMRLKRMTEPQFPNHKVYLRFGNKNQLIGAVLAHAQSKEGLERVVEICRPLYESEEDSRGRAAPRRPPRLGFVYMVRGHPGEYKIGRTNLVDRRLSELGATGPVEHELVHYIETDDPAGVEAYWHSRFEKAGKRMRGEWFRLRPEDVAAFKRWRRIA